MANMLAAETDTKRSCIQLQENILNTHDARAVCKGCCMVSVEAAGHVIYINTTHTSV